MAIKIQELLPSDQISDLADKINFNFDQILRNGGGPLGPQGDTGGPGGQGLPGENGTKWFVGNNSPVGITILGSQFDDLFLDRISGDVYRLDDIANDWVFETNIRGPQGASASNAITPWEARDDLFFPVIAQKEPVRNIILGDPDINYDVSNLSARLLITRNQDTGASIALVDDSNATISRIFAPTITNNANSLLVDASDPVGNIAITAGNQIQINSAGAVGGVTSNLTMNNSGDVSISAESLNVTFSAGAGDDGWFNIGAQSNTIQGLDQGALASRNVNLSTGNESMVVAGSRNINVDNLTAGFVAASGSDGGNIISTQSRDNVAFIGVKDYLGAWQLQDNSLNTNNLGLVSELNNGQGVNYLVSSNPTGVFITTFPNDSMVVQGRDRSIFLQETQTGTVSTLGTVLSSRKNIHFDIGSADTTIHTQRASGAVNRSNLVFSHSSGSSADGYEFKSAVGTTATQNTRFKIAGSGVTSNVNTTVNASFSVLGAMSATANGDVSFNNDVTIGGTANNAARLELISTLNGSPYIVFRENDDVSWSVGVDDGDNLFKIIGTTGANAGDSVNNIETAASDFTFNSNGNLTLATITLTSGLSTATSITTPQVTSPTGVDLLLNSATGDIVINNDDNLVFRDGGGQKDWGIQSGSNDDLVFYEPNDSNAVRFRIYKNNAGVNVESGGLYTGGTQRITSAGALTSITTADLSGDLNVAGNIVLDGGTQSIRNDDDIRFLRATTGAAQRILTGGVMASSSYASTETAKIPSNGIYALGNIRSDSDLDINGGGNIAENLTINSGNVSGRGLFLSDDGSFVDLNNGYGNFRFTNGIRIYEGKNVNTNVRHQFSSNGNYSLDGTVSANSLTTVSTATIGSDLTVNGDTINLGKQGTTTSRINFAAQTNDPGYIEHFESNNTARLRFQVSDDANATDIYEFYGGTSVVASITATGTIAGSGLNVGSGSLTAGSIGMGNDATLTMGSTTANNARIEIRTNNGATPEIFMGENGDARWVVSVDDADNNFKINGSTSGAPVSNATNPSFEVSTSGILNIPGSYRIDNLDVINSSREFVGTSVDTSGVINTDASYEMDGSTIISSLRDFDGRNGDFTGDVRCDDVFCDQIFSNGAGSTASYIDFNAPGSVAAGGNTSLHGMRINNGYAGSLPFTSFNDDFLILSSRDIVLASNDDVRIRKSGTASANPADTEFDVRGFDDGNFNFNKEFDLFVGNGLTPNSRSIDITGWYDVRIASADEDILFAGDRIIFNNSTIHTSDERLKSDGRPLTEEFDPLEILDKTIPMVYVKGDRKEFGFYAQQVEKIEELKELVHQKDGLDEDHNIEDVKHLSYNDFHAITIAGVKKLKKENEDLKDELADLKSQLSDIKQLIDEIRK